MLEKEICTKYGEEQTEEITYLVCFLEPSSEPRYYLGIHGGRDFHVSGDYATIAFSSATAPYRLCETV